MALGAMEALAQLGLKVPDDVSVMGDDNQEISRHTHPPLTTMVLPNYQNRYMATIELESVCWGWVRGQAETACIVRLDGTCLIPQNTATAAATR